MKFWNAVVLGDNVVDNIELVKVVSNLRGMVEELAGHNEAFAKEMLVVIERVNELVITVNALKEMVHDLQSP